MMTHRCHPLILALLFIAQAPLLAQKGGPEARPEGWETQAPKAVEYGYLFRNLEKKALLSDEQLAQLQAASEHWDPILKQAHDDYVAVGSAHIQMRHDAEQIEITEAERALIEKHGALIRKYNQLRNQSIQAKLDAIGPEWRAKLGDPAAIADIRPSKIWKAKAKERFPQGDWIDEIEALKREIELTAEQQRQLSELMSQMSAHRTHFYQAQELSKKETSSILYQALLDGDESLISSLDDITAAFQRTNTVLKTQTIRKAYRILSPEQRAALNAIHEEKRQRQLENQKRKAAQQNKQG